MAYSRLMTTSMTTDSQLAVLAKKLHIPLNGILFKDKLYKLNPVPNCYIINMANSDTHGSHWVALYLESPARAAYFDSFGEPNPVEITKFVNRFGCSDIIYSKKEIQNINSGWCGQFSLAFLAFMTRQKHIPIARRYQIFLAKFHDGYLRP